MRILFAALSARRPFPVARADALPVPAAWADPDPNGVRPLNVRVPPYGAPSPTTITTNSDSSLTAAQTMQTVTLTAAPAYAALDPDARGVVATIGRKRRSARNFIAAEDALKDALSLPIRKRFTCDCNSVFMARGLNVSQTARGPDSADRLPLSDPHVLNGRYLRGGSLTLPMSPTSLMLPDAIEHLDVPHGLVFAFDAGDATGSRVPITTMHKLRKLDASLDTQLFWRHYDDPYGFAKAPGGAHQAVHFGDPIARVAYKPTLGRHLENKSHLSQYASPNSSFSAKPGAPMPVSGAATDVGPGGQPRVIVGAQTLAHTRQPNERARMGHAAIAGRLGKRRAPGRRGDRYSDRNQACRSDTARYAVYTGNVKPGNSHYTIAWATTAPHIHGEPEWLL
jgi:iron complex outermembrane recepter protein